MVSNAYGMSDRTINEHPSQIPLGQQTWRPNIGWRPVSEELIKEGLECILNLVNQPVLVTCATGLHDTGTLMGCLRKLQSWNFNSNIVEYRSYTGGQGRYVNEQFIELFDMDLVTLPTSLPPWFILQQKMKQKEEEQNEKSLVESTKRLSTLVSPHSVPLDLPSGTPTSNVG
ncbi:hypothetical protein HKX48_005406 [Thoreauomyces humboldtii]|nr:hypothetical protein HKX48_005406 [Thoreauomyces humboldtii]